MLSLVAMAAAVFLIGLVLSRPYWYMLRKRVLKPNKEVSIHQGNCTYSGPGVVLPNSMQLLGIDVSHHQGLIDWDKVKSAYVKSKPLSFVFIRATYGRWKNDKYFTYNWKATQQVGLLRGAYHYYLPSQSALAQADKFLSRVCDLDGNYLGDLPPVLDIEELPVEKDRDDFHKDIQIWLDRVENKTGMRPIIYAGSKFYKVHLFPKFKSYPFWVAHYQISSPSVPSGQTYDLWQFTDKARIDGICSSVDLNISATVPAFFPLEKLAAVQR